MVEIINLLHIIIQVANIGKQTYINVHVPDE